MLRSRINVNFVHAMNKDAKELRYNKLSRDYNCDSTTIRLRYDDTTTHSTTTEVIEITIRLRYDFDPTI